MAGSEASTRPAPVRSISHMQWLPEVRPNHVMLLGGARTSPPTHPNWHFEAEARTFFQRHNRQSHKSQDSKIQSPPNLAVKLIDISCSYISNSQ